MRKSLAIIASALLIAVAAASGDRLRYDSSVFAEAPVSGGARAKRIEYPPCKKGVIEDRCIQLYERGVKSKYQRWLAAHGRGAQVAEAPRGGRTYRACRGRNDDRCQQRAATRQARAVRRARTQQAQRREAVTRRAQASRPVRAQSARAQVQRPRATQTRQRTGGGTPGI
jgi:hypothetical protein